jgi:hypothetical protein
MKQRIASKRRGFMSNALHLGKRAFGTADHFLLSHGANIKKFTEAAAPMLAMKGGPYGPAAGAIVGALGEGAGGYAALRQQLGG